MGQIGRAAFNWGGEGAETREVTIFWSKCFNTDRVYGKMANTCYFYMYVLYMYSTYNSITRYVYRVWTAFIYDVVIRKSPSFIKFPTFVICRFGFGVHRKSRTTRSVLF